MLLKLSGDMRAVDTMGSNDSLNKGCDFCDIWSVMENIKVKNIYCFL